MLFRSTIFVTDPPWASSASIEGRSASGDGGGVFSSLRESSRFFGTGSEVGASSMSAVCARFNLFAGVASSLAGDAIVDDVGEGVRELLLLFWRAMARFAAAARAALDTGT